MAMPPFSIRIPFEEYRGRRVRVLGDGGDTEISCEVVDLVDRTADTSVLQRASACVAGVQSPEESWVATKLRDNRVYEAGGAIRVRLNSLNLRSLGAAVLSVAGPLAETMASEGFPTEPDQRGDAGVLCLLANGIALAMRRHPSLEAALQSCDEPLDGTDRGLPNALVELRLAFAEQGIAV